MQALIADKQKVAEEAVEKGEITINVIKDLGKASDFNGCEKMDTRFRVIEVDRDTCYTCLLIAGNLQFDRPELSEKFMVLCTNDTKEEIKLGLQTFFITLRNKKYMLRYKWRDNMKHPDLMIASRSVNLKRKETEKAEEKEIVDERRQMRIKIRDLEDDLYASREKYRETEKKNKTLKEDVETLMNKYQQLTKDVNFLLKNKDELMRDNRTTRKTLEGIINTINARIDNELKYTIGRGITNMTDSVIASIMNEPSAFIKELNNRDERIGLKIKELYRKQTELEGKEVNIVEFMAEIRTVLEKIAPKQR